MVFDFFVMAQIPLFHHIIATGFGSGYSPIAPGTAGALLATVLWWAYASFLPEPYTLIVTICLVCLFTALGVWSSGVAERYWGNDPSRVVVDEMVGTWIALLAVPANSHWGYIIAAFVLFRFFDILKPLGIRKMENLPGGYGIMADDVLSGVYGMLLILIYRYFLA